MPEQRFRSGDHVICVEPIDGLVAGQTYEVWRSRMEPIGGEVVFVSLTGRKEQPMGQGGSGWFAFRFQFKNRGMQ